MMLVSTCITMYLINIIQLQILSKIHTINLYNYLMIFITNIHILLLVLVHVQLYYLLVY
jgi:hypothetical protein